MEVGSYIIFVYVLIPIKGKGITFFHGILIAVDHVKHLGVGNRCNLEDKLWGDIYLVTFHNKNIKSVNISC